MKKNDSFSSAFSSDVVRSYSLQGGDSARHTEGSYYQFLHLTHVAFFLCCASLNSDAARNVTFDERCHILKCVQDLRCFKTSCKHAMCTIHNLISWKTVMKTLNESSLSSQTKSHQNPKETNRFGEI